MRSATSNSELRSFDLILQGGYGCRQHIFPDNVDQLKPQQSRFHRSIGSTLVQSFQRAKQFFLIFRRHVLHKARQYGGSARTALA